MCFAAQQHVKQDRNSLNPHPFSMSWAGLSCVFFYAHFNGTIFSIKKWCEYIYIFFLNLFLSILLHFQVRAAKRNGASDVMFSTREKWHWRISSSFSQRADRNFSDLRVRERMKDSLVCQNSWRHVIKPLLFRRAWPVLIKHGYTCTILHVRCGLLYGSSLFSSRSSAAMRGGDGSRHYLLCFSLHGVDVVGYVPGGRASCL